MGESDVEIGYQFRGGGSILGLVRPLHFFAHSAREFTFQLYINQTASFRDQQMQPAR